MLDHHVAQNQGGYEEEMGACLVGRKMGPHS